MPDLIPHVLFSGRVPKALESKEYCQDYFCSNEQYFRFAIADGATLSFNPQNFSQALVNHFCEDDEKRLTWLFDQKQWMKWLEDSQQEWSREIKIKVEESKSDPRQLVSRNRYKSGEAGASTFVGLRFIRTGKDYLKWEAVIIGDSCLFHIRDLELLHSYLLETPDQFNNHPDCFSSLPKLQTKIPTTLKSNESVENGDIFILTTDALSKWFLLQWSQNKEAWKQHVLNLTQIRNADDFENFIDKIRNENQIPLEDDDVAVMVISCDILENKIVSSPLDRNRSVYKINRDYSHKTEKKPGSVDIKGISPQLINIPFKFPDSKSILIACILFILGVVYGVVAVSVYHSYFHPLEQSPLSYKIIQSTGTLKPSTPVAETDFKISIPKGSVVYGFDVKPIMIVENSFDTNAYTSISSDFRTPWLMFDVWLVGVSKDSNSVTINNSIIINSDEPCYIKPDINSLMVGRISSGTILPIIDQINQENSKSYRVIFWGQLK